MAQTKKRRRRKHRGTQGGSIDHARRSRPRTRAEAKAQARSQMGNRKKAKGTAGPRRPVAPSWRSAANRAAVGAGIFLTMLLLLFKQPAGTALPLAALMFVVYIPMGHSIDRFFYNRRLANERRAREQHGRS